MVKKTNKIYTKEYIAIILFLVAICSVFFIKGNITGNSILSDETTLYFPASADFTSDKEGTIFFSFNFPSTMFKIGNETADKIVFLDSFKMPGITIGYDTNKKEIYGGNPLIRSGEIEIMDGKPHTIAYSFNTDLKKQAITFDGNTIVESEFSQNIQKVYDTTITGNVIAEIKAKEYVSGEESKRISLETKESYLGQK